LPRLIAMPETPVLDGIDLSSRVVALGGGLLVGPERERQNT
jgi:hypothetical protein